MAYIGEAEVIRDRLRQHKARDFWNTVVLFVSKDENLTKAHVRYLENRLLQEATRAGRYQLENLNSSNPRLPESDREDMEVYLSRISQVLPVLGSDLLSPVSGSVKPKNGPSIFICSMKDAIAQGHRTESGFVVLAGSTAVGVLRASAHEWSNVALKREALIKDSTIELRDGLYFFLKDVEFSSPSTAATVIHGRNANGLVAWKDDAGMTLRDREQT